MEHSESDSLCAALPGAVLSGAGGRDAWKVGGKMRAFDAEKRATNSAHMAVTCPDVATAAAEKALYFRRIAATLPKKLREAR